MLVEQYQARNVSMFVSLGQTHDVRRIYLQEGFRSVQNYSYNFTQLYSSDFDIGIVRLETPIILGDTVSSRVSSRTVLIERCLMTCFLSNVARPTSTRPVSSMALAPSARELSCL